MRYLEIKSWKKYNPRSDVEHSSWFRLQNNFWIDPAISKLDNDGKMIWVVLLSLASQQNRGVIEVDSHVVTSFLRVPPEKLDETLESLQESDLIRVSASRPRYADVTSTLRRRTNTYERTNVRTNKKNTPPPSEHEQRLADAWLAHALSKAPHLKPDPAKYAQAIAKAKKATGLTDQQIEETLTWIKASPFWAANALSPAGLLTVGKNGLRKIDTIRAQMLESQPAPVRSTRELFNLVKKEEASGS